MSRRPSTGFQPVTSRACWRTAASDRGRKRWGPGQGRQLRVQAVAALRQVDRQRWRARQAPVAEYRKSAGTTGADGRRRGRWPRVIPHQSFQPVEQSHAAVLRASRIEERIGEARPTSLTSNVGPRSFTQGPWPVVATESLGSSWSAATTGHGPKRATALGMHDGPIATAAERRRNSLNKASSHPRQSGLRSETRSFRVVRSSSFSLRPCRTSSQPEGWTLNRQPEGCTPNAALRT